MKTDFPMPRRRRRKESLNYFAPHDRSSTGLKCCQTHELSEPLTRQNTKLETPYVISYRGAGKWGLCAVALALLLTGCKGTPTKGETTARQQVQAVTQAYRPQGLRPALSSLTTNSSLGDFLRFAILNQPKIEAAYYEWAASVERITVARSLPDPKLTFQSDIANIITSLMPGLMMEFPGPGKLKARAAVASAESEGKYYEFESAILQTAYALKKAYIQLHFLNDKIRVTQETLELLADVENIASKQNEVGKVTLQDVLRAQIEQERMKTELANLNDSRLPMLAQFKAALGLQASEANPPFPARFETTPMTLSSDELLATALARNPKLKAMEAEIHQAQASIQLATKSKVPDFNVGIEVDAKTYPVVVRPTVGVTLPIWKDKIAAEISSAQKSRSAAQSRLSAEQISLAVDLAEKSYALREAARNLALVRVALLPKARQSLEVGRAAYITGKTDFLNLMDAQRTLLGFQLTEVEAQTQQELALAELSLLITGQAPGEAPILTNTSKTAPAPSTR